MDLSQPRVHFHYFDALGSTVLVANNLGQVTDRYDYGAWGETYHLEGTTADNPYQYVGELGYYTHWQAPDLANMLHLGVRFYEPSVARLIQRDALGKAGDSYYLYAGDSPLRYVDPTGYTWGEAGSDLLVDTLGAGVINAFPTLKGASCAACLGGVLGVLSSSLISCLNDHGLGLRDLPGGATWENDWKPCLKQAFKDLETCMTDSHGFSFGALACRGLACTCLACGFKYVSKLGDGVLDFLQNGLKKMRDVPWVMQPK